MNLWIVHFIKLQVFFQKTVESRNSFEANLNKRNYYFHSQSKNFMLLLLKEQSCGNHTKTTFTRR